MYGDCVVQRLLQEWRVRPVGTMKAYLLTEYKAAQRLSSLGSMVLKVWSYRLSSGFHCATTEDVMDFNMRRDAVVHHLKYGDFKSAFYAAGGIRVLEEFVAELEMGLESEILLENLG